MENKYNKLSPVQVRLVLEELKRLQSQGQVRQQGSRTFVLCPFHADKNPSAIITTDPSSKYFGVFKCFGCGEKGGWNKLAKEMGLRTIDEEDSGYGFASKYSTPHNIVGDEKMTPENPLQSTPATLLKLSKPRPVTSDWRGIQFRLLRKVGAISVFDRTLKERALYLPVLVKGEEVGGIRALMKGTDNPRIAKYKNAPGSWSRTHALYPYDYIESRLPKFQKKHGFSVVILVEGARDALSLISKGLPALGILGTTSWSEQKRELLLDLDPDFVLICMDGDKAGQKAEDLIYEDLSDWLPCQKMNLTRFNRVCGYDVDPSNAPDLVINKIWKTIFKHFGINPIKE